MKTFSQEDLARLNWFGVKRIIAKALAVKPINAAVHVLAKRMLSPTVAARIPLARAKVYYQLASGERICLLDSLADIVARDIYSGGGKPTSLAEWRKLLAIEFLSEDAFTFMDIGAYSGLCALIAARSNPNLSAVTYEIVPENYFLSIRNIVENDMIRSVQAKLLGLGRDEGSIKLPPTMNVASHMTSISLGSTFNDGVNIPVGTLDKEAAGVSGRCVLKLDVEGFELDVLQGGASFISSQRPDAICEILPGFAGASAIERMLAPLDYQFHVFTETGIERREHIVAEATGRDWLFSVRPDLDRLLARVEEIADGFQGGSVPKRGR
jgi:FkbM family methyltransferase